MWAICKHLGLLLWRFVHTSQNILRWMNFFSLQIFVVCDARTHLSPYVTLTAGRYSPGAACILMFWDFKMKILTERREKSFCQWVTRGEWTYSMHSGIEIRNLTSNFVWRDVGFNLFGCFCSSVICVCMEDNSKPMIAQRLGLFSFVADEDIFTWSTGYHCPDRAFFLTL